MTAATYGKAHHFRGATRLRVLHRGLLTVAKQFGWQLEAWAVFSNHYHFVARSPGTEPDAASLSPMLKLLHVKTSGWVNKLDGTPQRQVWFNFRDTKLGQQRSYLARLNYVHYNPARHGVIPLAENYKWCSASWFARNASPAFVETVKSFKTDRVEVPDDF